MIPQPLSKRLMRALLVCALAALAVFLLVWTNGADADLWGHLRFGRDIAEQHALPRTDTYSYSAYGAPWINHEWLAELIFHLVDASAGHIGLLFLKTSLFLALFVLLFSRLKARTQSIILLFFFTALPLAEIAKGFAIRPQMFTYFFFTVLLLVISRHEESGAVKSLYWLPVMFLAWCNCHGGVVVGAGVLLFYTLYKWAQGKSLPRVLAAITALSLAATLINPYGPGLWAFLARAVTMPRPYIAEWGGVPFSPRFLAYFLLMAISALSLWLAKTKKSFFEIGTVCLAAVFSFLHMRHSVLFAIAAAVMVPRYACAAAEKPLLRIEEGWAKIILIPALLVAVFYWSYPVMRQKELLYRIKIDPGIFPADGVEFLKRNNIGGNMFCQFKWAEMCLRELSPSVKVFFDGRYETVYSPRVVNAYYDIYFARGDYREQLKRFPETDILFLYQGSRLARAAENDGGWVMIYSTKLARVFVKNNERNKDIIDKYRNNSLVYPRTQPPYYLQ